MKTILIILLFLLIISSLFPQQLYESQFIPFDGEEWDEFGRSVVMSDSMLFIGSPFDDNYTGSVYIYKVENGVWTFWKKLFSSDKQENYQFGYPLILEGNRLFIGAQHTRVNSISSGAAYLFVYENGDWVEKQKIVPPSLQYEGAFSISMASYKNLLLIGA